MGLTRTMTGLIFTAVFVMAIIFYATAFGNENNTFTTIDGTSSLNNVQNLIVQNLSVYSTDTEDSVSALWKIEASEGEESTRSGGQFKTNPTSALDTTKIVLSSVFGEIFGNDSQFKPVLTTLIITLAFIIGLYVWKTYKGGTPD